MARLGGTSITSFADLAPYMATTGFQNRGLLTGLFEAVGGLLDMNDRACKKITVMLISVSYRGMFMEMVLMLLVH